MHRWSEARDSAREKFGYVDVHRGLSLGIERVDVIVVYWKAPAEFKLKMQTANPGNRVTNLLLV